MLINSNVYVATSREWFTSFTPYKSTLGNNAVEGYGDVTLRVRKSKTDPKSISIIVLKDVLYVPKQICNSLGNPFFKDYGFDSRGLCKDSKGNHLGYFHYDPLPHLWLEGRDVQQSSLKNLGARSIGLFVQWDEEEERKFEAYKRQLADPPRYTSKELAYLEDRFGGEFRFLRTYGLKMFKEDDRDEGKAILTALMSPDSDWDSAAGYEDEDDFPSFPVVSTLQKRKDIEGSNDGGSSKKRRRS